MPRTVTYQEARKKLGTCTAVAQWGFILGACIVCLLSVAYYVTEASAYADSKRRGYGALHVARASNLVWAVSIVASLLSAASAFFFRRPLMVMTTGMLLAALVAQVCIMGYQSSQLSDRVGVASQAWSQISNNTRRAIQRVAVGYGSALVAVEVVGVVVAALLSLQLFRAYRDVEKQNLIPLS
eukprot:m51a1_g14473 hypothetical protein (183) ;mRNA; r:685448-686389